MAGTIDTDFTIDYTDQTITYVGGFTNGIADYRYTMNELYSWLMDEFDEPQHMDDPNPMSAQTPTQYTLLYPWFIEMESTKALYSGSLQTSGWAKSGANGITAIHWADASSDPPSVAGDIGETVTQATSGATGVIVGYDSTRKIAWVRKCPERQQHLDEHLQRRQHPGRDGGVRRAEG
jgi:hypothetical protein